MSGPVTDQRAGLLLERYRQTFGGEVIPVPVEPIAEDFLGLRVEERDDLDCSGLLVPAQRRIWVNAREAAESPGRKRFTIAHELGHWVCQVLEGHRAPVYCRPADLTETADRALEREANVFAAELAMPESLVRREFEAHPGVDAMAARFNVSAAAMYWRLYNLRLIEERPD
jgi:Zn-dependent peptidase ImmA (M78 family)